MSTTGPQRDPALERTIEQLVRQVLNALEGPGLEAPAQSPTDPLNQSAPATETHVCQANLITLETLDDLPTGTRVLSVPPRAVVTPAVVEELKRRRITLRKESPGTQQSPGTPLAARSAARDTTVSAELSAATGMLFDADQSQRGEGLVKQLGMRGFAVTGVTAHAALSAATPALPCVLISSLPAVDVDHCARSMGLVAAAVDSPDMVRRVSGALRPSVWVLDAARLSFSGLLSVAVMCLRAATQTTQGAESGRKPR